MAKSILPDKERFDRLTRRPLNHNLFLSEAQMRIGCVVALMLFSMSSWGQTQRPIVPVPNFQDDFSSNRPSSAPTSTGQEYRIGPDDLVEVAVFEAPELGGVSRVTASGTISLPLVGPVDVSGRTPQEVERLVEEALKRKYVNDPHVTAAVREYASQPVSVLGAVKLPGIYQIKGKKTLLEMIAMAQGIDSMTAGKTIQVLRKNANPDSAASETITIDTEELFDNGKTELNIVVQAGDVINVVHAGSIFVVGEVFRPNEFVLRNGKNVTVTQAVGLANGPTKDAKKSACVIYRYQRDGTKEEIHVDYAKILSGGANDVIMQPNDILFVPANKIKTGLNRALESTIAVAMGRIVYAGF
jgi:polysaccharide export outer membrane protein